MALGGQRPLPGDLTAPGHNKGRAPILLQDSVLTYCSASSVILMAMIPPPKRMCNLTVGRVGG